MKTFLEAYYLSIEPTTFIRDVDRIVLKYNNIVLKYNNIAYKNSKLSSYPSGSALVELQDIRYMWMNYWLRNIRVRHKYDKIKIRGKSEDDTQTLLF